MVLNTDEQLQKTKFMRRIVCGNRNTNSNWPSSQRDFLPELKWNAHVQRDEIGGSAKRSHHDADGLGRFIPQEVAR
jgi:hypothetical protein